MLPWEREIYVDLLLETLREEKQRREEQQRKMRGQICQKDYQIKQQAQLNGYGGF